MTPVLGRKAHGCRSSHTGSNTVCNRMKFGSLAPTAPTVPFTTPSTARTAGLWRHHRCLPDRSSVRVHPRHAGLGGDPLPVERSGRQHAGLRNLPLAVVMLVVENVAALGVFLVLDAGLLPRAH